MSDSVIFFLIQVLNGVQYGLLLFLVASGLTLIFGIMRIINLAHGSFYMVGAYLAFALAERTGSLWLAILIAVPLSVLLGLLLELLLFRFLYTRDHLYQVLLTYGLILVFEELRSLLFGDDVHGVAVPGFLDFSLTRCIQRTRPFSSPAARTTSSRRFRITLWLTAVTPTFFPARTRSTIIRAPANVFPAPGGP